MANNGGAHCSPNRAHDDDRGQRCEPAGPAGETKNNYNGSLQALIYSKQLILFAPVTKT